MRCVDQKAIYIPVCGVETLVSVPCGKCIPCLISKRQEWVLRLEREHRVSKSAHFVTLTYDQKHLRTNHSLDKRDLQLYLKRLRKKDESERIRYYAVGEYGSRSGRPHYHLILFNSNEDNIRGAWVDVHGKQIGLVHVGQVSGASIAYVTKYVIQKGEPVAEGKERPFATMSRRYGLGGHYLSDEMVEWHRHNDANYVAVPDNGKARLPRFYRDKIWWKPEDRQRISKAAMALSLSNQEKERQYYALKYGDRGPIVMAEAVAAVISRIKQKIQYTQTF